MTLYGSKYFDFYINENGTIYVPELNRAARIHEIYGVYVRHAPHAKLVPKENPNLQWPDPNNSLQVWSEHRRRVWLSDMIKNKVIRKPLPQTNEDADKDEEKYKKKFKTPFRKVTNAKS